MSEKQLSFSYSKLATFMECQKRYELQYIKNLVEFKENIYTAFGEAIHKAIEVTINKKYDYDEAFSVFEKTLKERCALIDPRDMQLIFLSEWHRKAKDILQYFFDNFYEDIKNGKIEVLGVEKYFKYEILPGIFYNGIIDLFVKQTEEIEETINLPQTKVLKSGKQKVVIKKITTKKPVTRYKLIDWKTGSIKVGDNMQLLSYTLPILALENILIQQIVYVYLKHQKQLKTEIDLDLMTSIKQKIISIINTMIYATEHNTFDFCLDKTKCKGCNVKSFCDKEFEELLQNSSH